MDFDLYHDESKESGYWHGILLVPRKTRSDFLGLLQKARNLVKYDEHISFKGLTKQTGKPFTINLSWISIGVASLAQKISDKPVPFFLGKNFDSVKRCYVPDYQNLKNVIGAKFILFKVKDDHKDMDTAYLSDYGAKVETTLRMGLKGGIHLLGNENNPINIKSFHFHGAEHYGRGVDLERIVKRIIGLRPYCSFASNLVLDYRSGNHKKPFCQNYEDCQFLQMTDLLVGSFRTLLGECKNPAQRKIALPVDKLIQNWNEGPARMRNSRWFNGFCISECYLEGGEWHFQNIECKAKTELISLFN